MAEPPRHPRWTALEQMRRDRGHSLESFAKVTGVSSTMLWNLETGRQLGRPGLLYRVASTLGMTVTQLEATRPTRQEVA